jgi:hypothetical protein
MAIATKPTLAGHRESTAESADLIKRVSSLDWPRIESDLDAHGHATVGSLLSPAECAAVAGMYPAEEYFRSRVVMAKHGYGRGEYKYFAYPLPALVAALRESLYPLLAPIANHWNEALGFNVHFPTELAKFIKRCHKAGQERPTPLMLQYSPGDYNCLHQDIYGENVFPFQVAILLKKPEEDFTGGEFILTEQRPRMQSRVEIVPLGQGDAVIFPVRHRPIRGTRGVYRVNMRHGVSRVRSGSRQTLGIIFHDAR